MKFLLSLSNLGAHPLTARFLARNRATTQAAGQSTEAEKTLADSALNKNSQSGKTRETLYLHSKTSLGPRIQQPVAVERPTEERISGNFNMSLPTEDFLSARLAGQKDYLIDRGATSPESNLDGIETATKLIAFQTGQQPEVRVRNTAFLMSHLDLLNSPQLNAGFRTDATKETEDPEVEAITHALASLESNALKAQLALDSTNIETSEILNLNIGGIQDLLAIDGSAGTHLLNDTGTLLATVQDAVAGEAAAYFADDPETKLTKDFFLSRPYTALSLLEDEEKILELRDNKSKQITFVAESYDYEGAQESGYAERARDLLSDKSYFTEDNLTNQWEFAQLVDLTAKASAKGLLNESGQRSLDIINHFNANPEATYTQGGLKAVNLTKEVEKGMAKRAVEVLSEDVELSTDFFERNTGLSMLALGNRTFREGLEADAERINALFSTKAAEPIMTPDNPDASKRIQTAQRAILNYTNGLVNRDSSSEALARILHRNDSDGE